MSGAVTSFVLDDLAPDRRYKLLAGTVVPRPIALVTTISPGGVDNAAPFSFFNVFCEDPPLLVLGLQRGPDGSHKDTAANILRDGDFVVHMVDEPLAAAMNVCSIPFPPDESEPAAAGLTLTASRAVRPRRIVEAPVALECRRVEVLRFSDARELVIGRILHLHARPGLVDPATLDVNGAAYCPVGRLHGGTYARQTDRFDLPRLTLDGWRARGGAG